MSAEVRLPEDGGGARFARFIDRLAAWIARHWLTLFNLVLAVFVGLPFLAPVLAEVGATRASDLIYRVYAPTCHQLPERSFFLFGPKTVYTTEDLERIGVYRSGASELARMLLRWNGADEHGHKVAICERDVAIYGSLLIGGMVFGVLRQHVKRRNGKLVKMPLWLYALLLAPMAIDGATQLAGLRESDWVLRVLTGALFGGATVWLAYPYVEEAMEDVQQTARHAQSTKPHP